MRTQISTTIDHDLKVTLIEKGIRFSKVMEEGAKKILNITSEEEEGTSELLTKMTKKADFLQKRIFELEEILEQNNLKIE